MYYAAKRAISHPIVPKISAIVFFALIFWELSSAVYNSWFTDKTSLTQLTAMPRANHSKSSMKSLTTPFFGIYLPIVSQHVKQSSLDLNIVGVLFADDEQESQIIIQTGNEAHIFKVGDTLPNGILIKKITSEGMLIERGGSIERVSLPKDELFRGPSEI